MDSTAKKALVVATIALVLDLMWRKYRQMQLGQVVVQSPAAPAPDPFTSPLVNGVDGVTASQNPGFQSAINVSVNPDVAQYLSHHYLPLFGLVGFGTGGSSVPQ